MARGQTVILIGPSQIAFAKALLDKAPHGAVVNIRESKRSIEQNDKMWAMLSDVSRAKPENRAHNPETWKLVFMQALGHEIQFEMGLDNKPFPIGHSSSKLSKAEMSDLIEVIYAYGSQHGVVWTGPEKEFTA